MAEMKKDLVLKVEGLKTRFKVDKKMYSVFYQECLKRGIRLHPSRGRFYISTKHTEEDVAKTLEVFDQVFPLLKK